MKQMTEGEMLKDAEIRIFKGKKIIEGVVAEYEGEYWDILTEYGGIENAVIGNPVDCKNPTDMTDDPSNPDYDKLLKAKLVKIRKTIIYEIIE